MHTLLTSLRHRNPLHALAGSARFIKEGSERGSDIYEDACIVLDNATSMSNLLTAIVDWTSATSDTSEPVLVSTDVLDMCRRTVRTNGSVCTAALGSYGLATWQCAPHCAADLQRHHTRREGDSGGSEGAVGNSQRGSGSRPSGEHPEDRPVQCTERTSIRFTCRCPFSCSLEGPRPNMAVYACVAPFCPCQYCMDKVTVRVTLASVEGDPMRARSLAHDGRPLNAILCIQVRQRVPKPSHSC
jgi:hypothetical protein